jgi:hypothetical protein
MQMPPFDGQVKGLPKQLRSAIHACGFVFRRKFFLDVVSTISTVTSTARTKPK